MTKFGSYDEIAERIEREVKKISPPRKWRVLREREVPFGTSVNTFFLCLEIEVDGIRRGAEVRLNERHIENNGYIEHCVDEALINIAFLLKRE